MMNAAKATHSFFCSSLCLRDSVVQRFCLWRRSKIYILRTKEQRSGRESTELARTQLGAMEGDSGHSAYVHADRWQDPPRADSDANPLVERAVVRHRARTYYFGHAAADRRAARN